MIIRQQHHKQLNHIMQTQTTNGTQNLPTKLKKQTMNNISMMSSMIQPNDNNDNDDVDVRKKKKIKMMMNTDEGHSHNHHQVLHGDIIVEGGNPEQQYERQNEHQKEHYDEQKTTPLGQKHQQHGVVDKEDNGDDEIEDDEDVEVDDENNVINKKKDSKKDNNQSSKKNKDNNVIEMTAKPRHPPMAYNLFFQLH